MTSALLASQDANEELAIGAGDSKLLQERGPRCPPPPTPHNGLHWWWHQCRLYPNTQWSNLQILEAGSLLRWKFPLPPSHRNFSQCDSVTLLPLLLAVVYSSMSCGWCLGTQSSGHRQGLFPQSLPVTSSSQEGPSRAESSSSLFSPQRTLARPRFLCRADLLHNTKGEVAGEHFTAENKTAQFSTVKFFLSS